MVCYSGFHDLIEQMRTTCPDKTAIEYWESELRTISWDELARRVEERACQLKSRDHACEAIIADGSLECVIELFSACEAGLQVALLDPFMPIKVAIPYLREVDADSVWATDALRQMEIQRHLTSPRPPAEGAGAVLFFTSGTTSAARAVTLSDASLMASAFNGSALLPLDTDDTLLCMLPLSHVFGVVCGLLWGLACGATVALGRGPRHYADDFALFKPTAVAVVPRILKFLLEQDAFNDELALVLVGAADCPETLLEQVRDRGIRASLGYGLTETSSGVALSTGEDFHAMRICPEDSVTIAEDGEILLTAPTCLMRGYYRDPKRTSAVIEDGVFHTDDLGYLDDNGLLHVQGRKKDVIVLSNGTKIFIPEYEAAIVKALDENDVAVVQKDDELVLVCGKLPGEMTKQDLMTGIAPAMEMQPRGSRVTSIVLLGHELARTAAGDVERWKIREELDDGNHR